MEMHGLFRLAKNHLRYLIVILLLLTVNSGYAQENRNALSGLTIEGQVIDDEGISIIGVTVIEKGTTNGTITDVNGNFTLVTKSNEPTLLFSFIGLVSREIKVTDNNKKLYVRMTSSAINIDEVVVVGYGVQEKESLLSAIDQVSGENIEKIGASNVSAALSGLSPGLLSMSTSGQPGADQSDLYIRGRSSLNDDKALVVVDGIKIEGGFEYMDPEEISSVSILKDAAATAVYGVEGANGVVIITTKRGHKGKARVSVNADFTLKQPTEPLDLLGSYDSHSLYNVAAKNDNQWSKLTSDEALQHYKDQDLPYIYPDVNWYDETVRSFAFASRSNITVSGGSDLVNYFTTVGYSYEGDAFKKGDFELPYDSQNYFHKVTYRTNLDFQISPTTTFSTDFAGRFEEQNESGDLDEIMNNMFEYPSWATPTYYPSDILDSYPDSNPFAPAYGQIRYAGNSEFTNSDNPYMSLYGNGVTAIRRNVLTANFVLKQKLDFITKGLSVSGRYNLSANYAYTQDVDYSAEQYVLAPDGSWSNLSNDEDIQQKAQLSSQDAKSKSDRYYYNVQFDYKRSFGSHHVSALGLWSRSKRVSGSNFPDYKEDWVGRATYNFRKKYLMELSGAYNGTDRFLPGNQFGFFPSGSIGWDIAKESFVKDKFDFLNQLKLRYSIGQSGSEAGSTKRMYFGSFVYADKGDDIDGTKAEGYGDMYFGEYFGDQGGYVREDEVGNPNATWETATKQNLGVDFALFNKRISGSVELFNEKRENIFLDPSNTIPLYYGSTATFKDANIGEVQKHGYEISLNYSEALKNGISYYVRLTYGFNENRVVVASEPSETPEYQSQEEKPIGTNQVYITDGYLNSIDEVLNYVTPSFGGTQWQPGDLMYVDYNGDGMIESEGDKIYYGSPKLPQTQYGITIGGQYKNWSAKIFATGVGSRSINGSSYLVPFRSELAVGARDIHSDYWTPENLDASYPTLHAISDGYSRINQASTFQLLDASYFRIKNAEIAYSFNIKKNRFGVDQLRLTLSGYNLLTFSDIDVGDPELSGPNNYPIMRRYTLGFKLDF
ncbi:SusC/RagA family TonB-linked outer membrane protein [Geofilum sp. OHC36d9]|uniref:SusC/RagA family TonB-linked outer membrane protein n=1 Tax=Geofilum sp. OHC36d9 TaxID=3458413 RepID=UPI0040338381